jgi:DNA modification methylase
MTMNRLFYGDNIDVLRKYIKDETVKLCYIDPPFNSKRNYNLIYNNIGEDDKTQTQAFIDTWTWDDSAERSLSEIKTNSTGGYSSQTVELIIGLESVLKKGTLLSYLVSLTQRIQEIYRVLTEDGTFFLHCDPTASHYLKIICDSIFCSRKGQFQNEIVWRRTGSHNKIKRFGPIHDIILFYSKSQNFIFNNPKKPYMAGHVKGYFIREGNEYHTNYYGNVLTGSGTRNGDSGKPWRGFDPTQKGRHWAIPGALLDDIDDDISDLNVLEKLEYFYQHDYIKIIEGQAWPIYEHKINQNDGQPVSDIWSFQPYTENTVFNTSQGIDEDVRWLSPKDKERLGYPTQKPEGLLHRIIKSCSNEGDLILDAYCGCGTTVSVSQKISRNWIGIDITYHSISLILRRLADTFGEKVLENIELNGTPRDFDSAVSLANNPNDKTRKEFEKWSVLTYSNNKSAINSKKGGDRGIDGIAYFVDGGPNGEAIIKKVIFSVKSNVNLIPNFVRDLYGTVEREKAACGVLITLYDAPNLLKEAKTYGKFVHNFLGLEYDKISVVTIKEILNGARLNLPLSLDVIKKAERSESQKELF